MCTRIPLQVPYSVFAAQFPLPNGTFFLSLVLFRADALYSSCQAYLADFVICLCFYFLQWRVQGIGGQACRERERCARRQLD